MGGRGGAVGATIHTFFFSSRSRCTNSDGAEVDVRRLAMVETRGGGDGGAAGTHNHARRAKRGSEGVSGPTSRLLQMELGCSRRDPNRRPGRQFPVAALRSTLPSGSLA